MELKSEDIESALLEQADEEQRKVLCRFFKTGKGEYGEGDKFIGLKVPITRQVVKLAKRQVKLDEIEKLLLSQWHEVRLAGLLLLVEEMKAATPKKRDTPLSGAERRKELTDFFLAHARQANNWDLVDLSCEYILGTALLYPGPDGRMPDRSILDRLAVSDNLWEQRISIVSTLTLIRANQFDDTLRIAGKLISHRHDLIHKAVGWMLREVGKRDKPLLEDFLEKHYNRMSRTTLRYAIERFPEHERRQWLKRPASKA